MWVCAHVLVTIVHDRGSSFSFFKFILLDKASEVSQALQQSREELAQVHDECQKLRELHSVAQVSH